MKKENKKNIEEIKGTNLPNHLQELLIDRVLKADKIGFDPEWSVKAKRKADNQKNDFNPIHAMI